MGFRIAGFLSCAVAFVLSFASALAQDESNRDGKLAFNSSCRTCHSMDEGDNRLGPSLHEIVGRKAGSEEYGYSPAMKSSGIVWDAATLDRFIQNPDSVVSGNNMKPFGGVSDAAIRESIVSYLSGESVESVEGSEDDKGE
ncbi:MAG TPA: c-type cytochrome [Woeseiaceae bacterium]|nr:c-type cytochrome [Woeseiaceae bacterium]